MARCGHCVMPARTWSRSTRMRRPSTAWAEFAGPQRTCASIIGPSDVALALWHRLADRWGPCWGEVRNVRPHQPVMSLSGPPSVTPDPRVHRVTLDQWTAYTEAAVKMYTEEIGVSPTQGNPAGYRFYVRQLITSGRAFGIIDQGRVIFKADLGSVSGSVCQVQGVWLDPALRGRGLAASAMAAVVQMARTRGADRVALRERLQPGRPGDLRTGWLQHGRRVRHDSLLVWAWRLAPGRALQILPSSRARTTKSVSRSLGRPGSTRAPALPTLTACGDSALVARCGRRGR